MLKYVCKGRHKSCNLPPPLLINVKLKRDFKCQNCKHVNPPMHTRASGDFSRCDPAGIQTQDLQNRNLTLYSAKLRSHFFSWCKDSARRAENKRKTCFSFFSRAAAYLGRKPKCARRAENKGKLVFLFLPRCSLSCERTRSVGDGRACTGAKE